MNEVIFKSLHLLRLNLKPLTLKLKKTKSQTRVTNWCGEVGSRPGPLMPIIKGLSWLAVELITSFPSAPTPSHAHPDPNLVAAACFNAGNHHSLEFKRQASSFVILTLSKEDFISSKLPNDAVIACWAVLNAWIPSVCRSFVGTSVVILGLLLLLREK